LERLVVALAATTLVILAVEEIPRILFPWDLRMFSESTLLTDMLKMTAGHGPYTAPSDQNSYIYAPGLEYLTFALLRPLGAQLDIRACRAVTVLVGLAAAFVAGGVAVRLAESLGPLPHRRAAHFVAASVAALVVFKSFTADACHPDNLYCLHAMLVIALCSGAVDRPSFGMAVVAVVVAGLGVAVKQTALPGALGALIVVLGLCRRAFGLPRSALLAASSAVSVLLGAWLDFHGWGRFWALEVPSHQTVEPERVFGLVAHVMTVPHRILLVILFVPSVLYLAMRARDRAPMVLGPWLAVGVTEVLPSLASYFKVLGWWNNLTILDLWAALPIVAVVAHVVHAPREERPMVARAVAAGLLVTLLDALNPTRAWPRHGQFELGRALDAAVARDVADGQRVLVSTGSAALVHAGVRDVPLDRVSSIAEREVARLDELTETKARFATRYYGKLYLIGEEAPTYPPEVQQTIDANYHPVGTIDGDGMPPTNEDLFGVMGLMRGGIRVLEANR
ncbi:MAG: hypothetical protein ABSE49_31705, partial [Polyangiaceae bacterium]